MPQLRPTALFACLAALVLAAGAEARSPWALLTELRQALKEGPQAATFEQTYVPAGFQEGDVESGSLALGLPACLRWSYGAPERKNYLICNGDVYQWNDGEQVGRRYEIDPTQEAGLDLLLVPVETLRRRYRAESRQRDDGDGWTVLLSTPDAPEGRGFSAEIDLGPELRRVERLAYVDAEGNRTTFTLDGWEPLAHEAVFTPPADVDWQID